MKADDKKLIDEVRAALARLAAAYGDDTANDIAEMLDTIEVYLEEAREAVNA